jgi:hypothetical protein
VKPFAAHGAEHKNLVRCDIQGHDHCGPATGAREVDFKPHDRRAVVLADQEVTALGGQEIFRGTRGGVAQSLSSSDWGIPNNHVAFLDICRAKRGRTG